MGNWFSDFFEETGEFLSENLGTIATVAGTMAGVPPGTANILKGIGLLTSMGKKGSSAAEKTNALIQSGIDAQTAYQMAALDELKSSGQQATAIATADKQMAYDINRGQYAANQQNILPYQMASLSALQALPQLQQLLGLNAYNIPMSISQYTPPEANYAKLYAATQEQLFPTASTETAATTENGGVGTGLRVNPHAPDSSAALSNNFMGVTVKGLGAPSELYQAFVQRTGRAPTGEFELYSWDSAGRPAQFTLTSGQEGANPLNFITSGMIKTAQADARGALPGANSITSGLGSAIANYQPGLRANMRPADDAGTSATAASTGSGATTTQSLTPYTGAAYDLNNSPLYLWQKQQAEEALTNQLAAAGLSGGTYAQRELARQNQGLAAQERERVVSNLQSLASMGMQGAGLGQASFTTPQSSDLLNAYNTNARNIADIYGNLGNIAGTGATQLAQNATAAYNAQQQRTSVWQDLYELASTSGWFGNKSNKSSGSSGSAYTTALGYTMPGNFTFKSF